MYLINRLKSIFGGGTVAPTRMAAAATMFVPDGAAVVELTGTDTVTSLRASAWARNRTVLFRQVSGATTFTNTASATAANQMDLGIANITLSATDSMTLFVRSDGVWERTGNADN